jgi:F-type H+-transporting ATPase subunit delta
VEELAQVYSRSLFEVAKERDELDAVRDELGGIVDALDADQNLAVFFFSPYFSTSEKKDALGKVITGASDTTINFLKLLIEKHRMPVIFRVRTQYDKLWRDEHKLLPVEVTSAIELDDALVDRIGKRIGEEMGRNVEVSRRVDPDILGGLVLRVGNAILDASIATRLNQLRKQVARA